MKKIIIILLILLLLGGGGAAAYFFYFKDAEVDEQAIQDAVEEVVAAPVFLTGIEGLTIPVIRNGQVVKFILINVSVEIAGAEYLDLGKSYLPKLQDRFIRSTHAYFAHTPIEKPVNVRVISRRLKKIAVDMLGTKVVKDVFIEGVFERRGS